MDALVTASFLLVGWNTYSAIVVAKDTYTGKMPGPKSIGYSIAGLAGLTAFMLYTFGIAAEKHPELLEAEEDVRCNECGGINNPHASRGPYKARHLCDCTDLAAEDREDTERMTRPEAEALADKVEKLVAPYVDRVEVCGSYRRGSSRPGDLDVIIIPKKGVTLPDMVKGIKPSAVNWIGEKKTQVILDDRKVDFRVSSPKGWGAAQLYFTGPAGYNIGMRMRAKKMGMKLNEYGIFDRATDKYLGGATEDEIYQVLGKTPKMPSERSKRAEQTFGRLKADPNKCAQCGSIGETFIMRGRHFCGPICLHKYEGLAAETQTFEAPRATYTDPGQQSFEKSYNIRAKKPLNKIVKESSGGKLPSDDSRQYYGYGRSHTLTDVTVEDYKLIQGYLTIQNMARNRFLITNMNWFGSKFAGLNASNVLDESIVKTDYLSKAVKHYHELAALNTDQEKIDYMNNANMTSRDFDEMLDFIRYYDITETGPYKGIRMVATDRAPYETGGGYGNVYYNSRNPYGDITNAAKFGEYDKANKTLTLSSRDAGATFTRLTKLRPYTSLLPISNDSDAYVEYSTDGGYGYRSSGSQSFRLTPFVCPEATRSDQRNPDPGYSSRQTKEGWRYDVKFWEEVKSAPYRYATLVYLPTQTQLQITHGSHSSTKSNVLTRKTIVDHYNKAKKLWVTAQSQAKAKKEEEEAKVEAASTLARKNQALTELENATKAMQDVIKSLVNQARNRGVPEDEIYDALENTLYDIEEMIEDWEPSDYFHAEAAKKPYGCKNCGTGPLPATIIEDKVFVLCPDCGLTVGSEDATAWNVNWSKDTPDVLHDRPFADVEWDTPSEG